MKSSPEALVIACFTFVVAVLLGGWQQIHLLAATTGILPGGNGSLVAVLLAVAVDVPVALAAVGATRSAAATVTPWARALGQATLPLAGLIVLASVIYVIGSLTSGQGHGYFLPRM